VRLTSQVWARATTDKRMRMGMRAKRSGSGGTTVCIRWVLPIQQERTESTDLSAKANLVRIRTSDLDDFHEDPSNQFFPEIWAKLLRNAPPRNVEESIKKIPRSGSRGGWLTEFNRFLLFHRYDLW